MTSQDEYNKCSNIDAVYNQLKEIGIETIFELDTAILKLLGAAINAPISKGVLPLIGRYITVGQRIISESATVHDIFELKYKWGDTEEGYSLTGIVISSKYHDGLVLRWDFETGWVNIICGALINKHYTRLIDAVADRPAAIAAMPEQRSYYKRRAQLTESALFYQELRGIAEE